MPKYIFRIQIYLIWDENIHRHSPFAYNIPMPNAFFFFGCKKEWMCVPLKCIQRERRKPNLFLLDFDWTNRKVLPWWCNLYIHGINYTYRMLTHTLTFTHWFDLSCQKSHLFGWENKKIEYTSYHNDRPLSFLFFFFS